MLEELSHSIHSYMTRGQYPTWHLEWENLVESWLARFIAKDRVSINEPLVLVGIVHYFESQHPTLGRNFPRRLQDDNVETDG
jgi:hypothetical protein